VLVLLLVLLGGGIFSIVSDGKVRMFFPTPKWSIEKIPDLSGKTALVTGANTGLGYETCLEMMKKGADVILGTRSKAKSQQTADRLLADTRGVKGAGKPVVLEAGLDLMSIQKTTKFAEEVLNLKKELHTLVLNAGIMAVEKFTPSADNIESQFAVNHVGHFVLTIKLLPAMASPSTIVPVSSQAHFYLKGQTIDLANINNAETYDAVQAYARSKFANILFAKELARRIPSNKHIFVNAIHPGFVGTDLSRHVEDFIGRFLGQAAANTILKGFVKTVALNARDGATTQLYAAVSTDVFNQKLSGEYFVPTARKVTDKTFELSALQIGMLQSANDPKLAKELWDWSVKTTGMDLPKM